jgi:predicted lipid-binding transport protein (Tim44 family)
MNSSVIQILVLAGIAVFLILKLRSVLGTREGFEPTAQPSDDIRPRPKLQVVETGPDRDIADNTADPASVQALAAMKQADPAFNVTDFLKGARAAYEMILMAFDKGEMDRIRPFLGPDVAATFTAAVADRTQQGLTITSTFAGIRELTLTEASYNPATKLAEIDVRFLGELSRTVRDANGAVVEGSPNIILKQRDTWTFARTMGTTDPNWHLAATGD